jgi:hypothetical protein
MGPRIGLDNMEYRKVSHPLGNHPALSLATVATKLSRLMAGVIGKTKR